MITYFILIKGAKGSAIIPPEMAQWFTQHSFLVFLMIIPVAAIILQALIFLKINILKPIVLIGTFALAMSFAANDLVNFIGVPMAGYHAFRVAAASDSPLTMMMGALGEEVPTQTYLLLLSGLVMVLTLWFSRKARTVTETEISLGQQDEGMERFGSTFLSRFIVGMTRNTLDVEQSIGPHPGCFSSCRL